MEAIRVKSTRKRYIITLNFDDLGNIFLDFRNCNQFRIIMSDYFFRILFIYHVCENVSVVGYDALRQGIEQFAVRNRCNLYVCCSDDKRDVFYMQLFASEENFRKRCSHCDTTSVDQVDY